jgi:guanylate kinase
VSYTNRAPRPDEVDGRDYHFISTEEFERIRDEGGFLESFEVYGDLKGTPRAPIEQHLAAGDDVLVEIDVQGALAIREQLPDACIVFVQAPSRAAQQARLAHRDAGATTDARLAEAEAEERLADRFDAVVVNDDLDRAVDEVVALLDAKRRAG